jgi:hypothetical protein
VASAFGTTYRFRPPGTAGKAARWAIALHALALALGGVASIVLATGDGEWTLDQAATIGGGAWAFGPMIGPMRTVFAVQAVTSIVAMVAWLTWQSRATENAWATHAAMRVTPGWAVLWWFIPFANMGKPAGAVSQLVRSTDPATRSRRGDDLLVVVWWAAFLTGQILTYVGFLVLIGEGLSVASASYAVARSSDIDEGLWVTAVGMLLQAVSAAPAIAIIGRVDRRQLALEGGRAVAPAALASSPPPRPDMR